jgi:large subunit ribosomal protein L9
MKVILTSDVKKLGRKGEVKEVADGYARNFLIARGLAVASTEHAMEILEKQKEEEREQDAQHKAEAEELAKKLEKITLTFQVNSKGDRVFGSVSTKQIVEQLAKNGVKVDKRKFVDTYPLSSLGYAKVRVELYKGVIGTINCHIVGSDQ